MLQYFFLLVLLSPLTLHAAEVFFADDFDSTAAPAWKGAGKLEPADNRRLALHITSADPTTSATATISLPFDRMRDAHIYVSADVRGQTISAKPQPWNGAKLMLVIQTPDGPQYPQAAIPTGTFPWQHCSFTAAIPADTTAITLLIGLEKVSGDVWFDNVRVSLRKRAVHVPPADPAQPIYRGHSLPRLRGAMVPNTLAQADLAEFADKWNANLIRWQLVRHAARTPTPESFDTWLDGQLTYLDQVLIWAQQHHIKIVVDLHSPPGGQASQGGYVAAVGAIFSQDTAQKKFIECWQKIATRYKGRQIIWGFDLMNEPVDTNTAEGCDDWQDLSLKAARAIHAIDPSRTLIVECPDWGNPRGFSTFSPLPEPNIVYSFHLYTPHEITHQGIYSPSPGQTYPGVVNGHTWDKAALEQAMKPAIDFAQRYRVHMYVGEFSCVRTAPGDTTVNYLTDAISLFEKYGFDWSYHAFREWPGWSVEHEGPLKQPIRVKEPPASQRLLRSWYAQNARPQD